MKDISIKDLQDLVIAGVDDADSRLEQMFKWHFEREMTITKWVLGTAATLAVGLLVAYFKTEIRPSLWQSIGLGLLPLATSSYGFYRFLRTRSIHRQFISALRIYTLLKSIRPFIVMYRNRLAP